MGDAHSAAEFQQADGADDFGDLVIELAVECGAEPETELAVIIGAVFGF